ncbi:putative bifunctional diguanylate cyclase/phosphodiesterase [Cohnella suwonensis]|uniref:Bifunctional diguanylate cyclase/phosphodiesterase n=1 Tax=Cohnella suwonensis TaxID=696072 RepID=A0ABW0LTG1_9BACL
MAMNRAEMKTAWTVIVAVAVFLCIRLLNGWLERILSHLNQEAAHAILESFAATACFSLLVMGWLVFVPTLCMQRLMTAALFTGVGLFDLLHSLSGPGMPMFREATGEAPSVMLEWISQTIGAIGLLVVFSLRNPIVKPRARLYAIIPVVMTVMIVSLIVFRTESWNEAALERLAPYQSAFTLMLYAAAVCVLLFRHRIERPAAMLTIVQAIIWLFFAKIEDSFGIKVGEMHDLLVVAFKLIGYSFLLKGIYLVLIEEPYRRQKKNEAKVKYLAFHDELTGLPNRRLFSERVKAEMAHAQHGNGKFALLWLDVDRFKTINDSMGHSFGDRLLAAVAERLSKFAEKPENVFRLGGDEFALLVGDIADEGEAESIARKLVDLFGQPFKVGPSGFHITGSVGMALFPDDGNTLDLLLQNADIAMYNAKESRNSWKRYEKKMNLKAKEKLLLENDLRIALELDQFYLAYQPLVDLEHEHLVGAEALLRWSHPERGEISPADFIPLCEENGFILPLGEWVLRQACMQMKMWQDQGFPPIVMSVNLSIRQFRQHDLSERIGNVLKETGLEPQWLELEITESIMADVAFATSMLEKLKKIGVRISIDDFGTGYSSLYYLKRFPIDKLKIDRSFVNDVLTDRNDAAIVSGISAMARNLNLKVTAEGVESAGQAAFLKEQKCQEAQGYYYSRPVPADRFEALFEAERNKAVRGAASS